MNCKPGDLAVIVKTTEAGSFLLGRFVEVLSSAGADVWNVRLQRDIYNPVNGEFGTEGLAWDGALRPIRDGEGQDETLRLLGRPVGEPQAA